MNTPQQLAVALLQGEFASITVELLLLYSKVTLFFSDMYILFYPYLKMVNYIKLSQDNLKRWFLTKKDKVMVSIIKSEFGLFQALQY